MNDFTASQLEEGGDGPDPLSLYLEELSEKAFGDAIDAAAALRVDFDKNGPYSAYINDCKAELVTRLMSIDEIDPTNVAAVIDVQLAVRNFKSVIGFALKLIDGYSSSSSDSGRQPETGVGEPS